MLMTPAALKEPSVVDEVTFVTVGTTPSITSALVAPREPAAPGDARVSVALLPAASLIEPPFKARDDVET